MSTYSTLLYLGAATTSPVLVYTSPSSTVTVIRDMEMLSGAGSADHLVMFLSVSGSSPAIFQTPDTTKVTHMQWEGRIVLPPGGGFGFVTAQQQWTVAISGYQLVN